MVQVFWAQLELEDEVGLEAIVVIIVAELVEEISQTSLHIAGDLILEGECMAASVGAAADEIGVR